MIDPTVTVVRPRDLSEGQLARWFEIRRGNDRLASPYFHPEFTRCVGSVRDDVEVAFVENRGEVVAVLPFQRNRLNAGVPVGGRLNDYHGVIAERDADVDAERLVRDCGLLGWNFAHVLAEQPAFRPHHRALENAPYVDLSRGYDAFVEDRRRAGSKRLNRLAKKRRQMERDLGPLRFETSIDDAGVLRTLLAWKSEQYRRTGLTDVFAFDWTVRLIETIHARRDGEFGGVLSSLYAGGRLVAAEFGMRAGRVYHSWFPAYDPAAARYSPGKLLLVDVARAHDRLGIRRIDLGGGEDGGKTDLMSGTVPLASGSVVAGSLARMLRGGWRATRHVARSRRLAAVRRFVRPFREWAEFR